MEEGASLEEIVDNTIAEIDSDGDKLITLEEFMTYMLKFANQLGGKSKEVEEKKEEESGDAMVGIQEETKE